MCRETVEAARQLPPILRDVFVAVAMDDRRIEDAAADLGITKAAAKTRLARARVELRRRVL